METDFEVDDAIQKLQEDEVITEVEGKLYAVPIETALQKLNTKLLAKVKDTFMTI